jgi:SAM-dependent methyltransferase
VDVLKTGEHAHVEKRRRLPRVMGETSWILLGLLILLVLNYLVQIALQRIKPQLESIEGFSGATDVSETVEYLSNDEIYDGFYASIYDQLTQNMTRTQGKIALIMTEWKNDGSSPEQMSVVDAGCGTGMASVALAKMNVSKIIAVDKSKQMLEHMKNELIPKSTLSKEQIAKIEPRIADLMSPSALGGAEVTHGICLYFSLYYMPDIDAFFRNMFLWIKPGGRLAVEVVNKHKFDPMLESASPWMGFSLQKYSDERVTESKVTFDKFEYTGKFELTDPQAEFRETFKFKDGRVRKQRHRFRMPDIAQIVKSAQAAGWVYTKFTDLTVIGFEYAFLLSFRHP